MADRARSLLIKFLGDSKGLQGETDQVVGRLGKIKAAVGEADGVFGKLKAGGGAALEGVGGAGAIAAAGVAAAAAAAGKGLMDFERLGTEIGKGAEATGLSYEAFSRWKEVADDAGVSGAALEGTVGKFNKVLGASPGLLEAYGGELVKAADGTVDVNATFLNAIDTINGIEDPMKQAEAASKLFGRGWQEMGELINRGSGQLRTDLAAVDESKVFDEDKVDDARKLRDAFDSIRDAGESLFLTIGENLAPVVADLAPQLEKAVQQVKPLAEGFSDMASGALAAIGPIVELANKLTGPLTEGLGKVMSLVGDVAGGLGTMIDNVVGGGKPVGDLTDLIGDHVIAQAEQRDAIRESNAEFDDGAAKVEYYASRVEAATDKTLAMVDAARELQGELDDTKSWIDAQKAVDDYAAKIAAGNLSLLDKQALLVEVKQKLLDYATSLEDVPPEKQTEIIALIDQGKIEEAEAALANLTRARIAPINPSTGGQYTVVPKFDGGGVMPGPRGQHSLALVAGGETILPTHKGPVTVTGGGGPQIVVQGNVIGDAGVRQVLDEWWRAKQNEARGNR